MSEKSGNGMAFTVRLAAPVRVNEPLVAVTENVDVPVGESAAVVTVNGTTTGPETEVGTNVAVAPGGRPLTVSSAGPAKPFSAVVSMCQDPAALEDGSGAWRDRDRKSGRAGAIGTPLIGARRVPKVPPGVPVMVKPDATTLNFT